MAIPKAAPLKKPPRPLFRWAGSKRLLIPAIQKLCPDNFERYIEPFAGSAAVFVALQPAKAILSDINSELMRTYKAVRSHPARVARQARRWAPDSETYYRVRCMEPDTLTQVGRAARFVYLNRYCFNGVYRENKSRRFNVPYGHTTGKLPAPKEFSVFAKLLQGTRLLCCDFEKTITMARRGDLLYVDPPYYAKGRRFRGEYGYSAFDVGDEKRLIKSLQAASRRGVNIILSYNGTLLARLPKWRAVRQLVVRNVGGFSSSRRRIVEYLYTNMDNA